MVDTTILSVSIGITHYQIIISLHISPTEAIELFVSLKNFYNHFTSSSTVLVIYADLSGD